MIESDFYIFLEIYDTGNTKLIEKKKSTANGEEITDAQKSNKQSLMLRTQ